MDTDTQGRGGYVLLLTGVAALGGLLFGYDTAVISGAIGFLSDHFQLDPQVWKGWAAASALIGCALGAAMAGALSDRFGRRGTLLAAAVLFFISAVGTALPRTFAEFVFYRIIGGLGVGAASMTSPMYIAEISPARIRGRMISVNQFAIIAGMLVVYFVNYFIAQYGAAVDQAVGAAEGTWNTRLGWRWMFASEALPAGLFLLLLFRVPESPRWLVMRGREERAAAVLARLGGSAHAAAEIADIRDALARENGTWAELFKPGMKTILLIGVVLAVLQQVTGINVFLYFAPDIFRKLGSGTDTALLQTVLVGAVNLAFTIVAIWTVDLVGRKPLMLFGAGGMGVCLLAMGLAAYWQRTEVWMLAFVLGYIACFALSVGPVTWVILAEIFPTALRGRAMAVATVCLWIANYLVTQTFTIMDESPALVERFHHGLPFWVYAAFCLVSLLFVWRFVPETKGKTLEQIQRELVD